MAQCETFRGRVREDLIQAQCAEVDAARGALEAALLAAIRPMLEVSPGEPARYRPVVSAHAGGTHVVRKTYARDVHSARFKHWACTGCVYFPLDCACSVHMILDAL